MQTWKMPPKAKIYEALSAVADGRVNLTDEGKANVLSSAKDKTYIVRWGAGFKQITSDDNASRWQGYIGYPIIAVLVFCKVIDVEPDIYQPFAGIEWNELNKKYKRDYDKVVDLVLDERVKTVEEQTLIVDEVDRIYEKLESLELSRLDRTVTKA